MVALVTLWEASLLLCLVGALALLCLIVARFVSARTGRQRKDARARMLPLLIGGGAEQPVDGVDARVAMDLTIELAELMRGSDRDAMLGAAERLDVPRHLGRRMGSRTAQDRLTAAETLALFPGREQEVERALDDRDPDVRLGAALALADRPDAPTPGEIVRRLGKRGEERSLLMVSLMTDLAARDPEAVRALVFDGALPDETRIAAIEALAGLGHSQAQLVVSVACEMPFAPHLRPRLIAALGRTGHPGGRDLIARALSSARTEVRVAAAQAAGQARLVDLAGPLGDLLGDEVWTVRFRAAEALLKLGKRGVDRLLECGDGDDPVAREAARTMLAERAQA
jgi:HEAT repeat protein